MACHYTFIFVTVKMSFSTAQLSPSILHSLVDNFFEGKKALVKERLRMSMDNIVNDLFDEMVGQVKEMLLPSKDPPLVSAPLQVIPKPPVASKSPSKAKPTLPKVKKVLPSFGGHKPVSQPSTSKQTADVQVVSGSQTQFGQKRTAESTALVEDTSANIEFFGAKKAKPNDHFDESAIYDDYLANYDLAIDDAFKGGDKDNTSDEPTYHIMQPAATDYSAFQENGEEEAHGEQKAIEVHVQYQAGMDPFVNENANDGYSVKNAVTNNNSGKVSLQFVCQEAGCGKVFNRKDNLKRHSRQHSRVKPYVCTFPNCSFDSSDKSVVIRHIQAHLKSLKLGEGEQLPEATVYLRVKQELL